MSIWNRKITSQTNIFVLCKPIYSKIFYIKLTFLKQSTVIIRLHNIRDIKQPMILFGFLEINDRVLLQF